MWNNAWWWNLPQYTEETCPNHFYQEMNIDWQNILKCVRCGKEIIINK